MPDTTEWRLDVDLGLWSMTGTANFQGIVHSESTTWSVATQWATRQISSMFSIPANARSSYAFGPTEYSIGPFVVTASGEGGTGMFIDANNYQYRWNESVRGSAACAQDVETARVRAAERSEARTRAVSRAEELLLSMMCESQRESYRLDGTFEVMGSHGNLYRIERGTSGNVLWLGQDGQFLGRLCAHPTMRDSWLPMPDVALAQMLAITTDERAFVNAANVHAGGRPTFTT